MPITKILPFSTFDARCSMSGGNYFFSLSSGLISLIFIFLFSVTILSPGRAQAFSLKQIEIKSKFGDPFKAEVAMITDGKSGLKVFIGSSSDYAKLGLNRKPVVDNLIVDPNFTTLSNDVKLVRIYSNKPVFYPSLDLVLKATLDGNTILEKFFLAVDFRTNLNIGIVEPKKKKKEVKERKPEKPKPLIMAKSLAEPKEEPFSAEAPPTHTIAEESLAAAAETVKPASTPIVVKPTPVPVIQQPTPTPVSETYTPTPATLTTEPAPAPVIITPAPTPISIRPTPVPALEKPTPSPTPKPTAGISKEKSIHQVKKPVIPRTRPKPPREEGIPAGIKKIIPAKPFPITHGAMLTEKVRYGDTLFKIADRLVKDKRDIKRAVVALWALNQDKFRQGNMNRMKRGGRFDYTHLETKMAEISRNDALDLIKQQWLEFLNPNLLLAKKKPVPVAEGSLEVVEGPLKEVFLPGEINPSTEKILENIFAWRNYWVNEDLERYINMYSTLFRAKGRGKTLALQGWKEHKRNVFDSQGQISVSINDIQVRKQRDHYVINFLQNYKSDSLSSFGLKTLDLIYEQGDWKIFREGFKKTNAQEQASGRRFPYVIHIASISNASEALEKANHLRRLGYAAYISPQYFPGKGSYYRIVLDRFSSEKEANYLAYNLMRSKIVQTAVPSRLPYALEVSSYTSEKDAYERTRELRAIGFSAYLFSFSATGGSRMEHKVLIGAFESLRQAQNLSSLLEKKSIKHQIIQP